MDAFHQGRALAVDGEPSRRFVPEGLPSGATGKDTTHATRVAPRATVGLSQCAKMRHSSKRRLQQPKNKPASTLRVALASQPALGSLSSRLGLDLIWRIGEAVANASLVGGPSLDAPSNGGVSEHGLPRADSGPPITMDWIGVYHIKFSRMHVVRNEISSIACGR